MRKGLLTAALLALLISAPAQADSIVFNKDGDLWLAYPDGSQRTLLASDKAAYGHASVADDGTVVATWGGGPGLDPFELRRLDRSGKVLSRIQTAAKNANWGGVYWARVSPDGTKIAYTFSYQHSQDLPGCPLTPQECAAKQNVYGTIVTHADRETPIGELGFFKGWTDATWIDNERLLLTRGGTNNAGVATVGNGATTVRPWTTFDGVALNVGAANRQLSRVAFKPVIRTRTPPAEPAPQPAAGKFIALKAVGTDAKPLNGTCMTSAGGGTSICDNCNFIDEKMSFLREETMKRGFATVDGVHMGPCEIHRKHAHTIGPDGALYACPGFTGDPQMSTGHIDGRQESWRQTAANRFDALAAWKQCDDCAFIPVCAGGCTVAAHTELGDLNAPNCHKSSFEAGLVTLARQAAASARELIN